MAGKYATLQTAGADMELEGERVFKSSEEFAAELRRRGLPVPIEFDDERMLERERLIAEKQAVERRLKEAVKAAAAEKEQMLRPPLSEGGGGLRVVHGAEDKLETTEAAESLSA